MGFELKHIVPWGRNLAEYRKFFQLTESDLDKSILACADGPASVNAELTEKGKVCISFDPLYSFSKDEIASRIRETSVEVYQQLLANRNDYLWDDYNSPETVLDIRLKAMNQFLEDYDKGKSEGRYIACSLPDVPVKDKYFDLILCSHFLFTYTVQLTKEFHLTCIRELLARGSELRIFPICALNGLPSPHLDYVKQELEKLTIHYELVETEYEFQKGGNLMLKIFSNQN